MPHPANANRPLSSRDPVAVAWSALEGPLSTQVAGRGICARCASPDQDLVAVTAVLSRGFTSIEQWRHPSGWGLCQPCAWSYATTELRRHPHLVRLHPPALQALSPLELGQLLTGPVKVDVAVTVPSRPGRKHVLPSAQWGRVTLDETPLTWTRADTVRLAALLRLRQAGAASAALTRPAPPWALIRASRQVRENVITDWEILTPWRERPQWLTLALLATYRPTTR